MTPARLESLETKLAYLEAGQDTLNEVVTRQQQQIARLEQLCLQLIDRLAQAGEPSSRNSPAEEVPPHY